LTSPLSGVYTKSAAPFTPSCPCSCAHTYTAPVHVVSLVARLTLHAVRILSPSVCSELIDTKHERDEFKDTVARLQKQIDDYRSKMNRVRKIEAMLKDVQEENERLQKLLLESGKKDQSRQLSKELEALKKELTEVTLPRARWPMLMTECTCAAPR
jgi:septal ring factor EnvC (AmiA/AmiB activator)